MSIQIEMFPAGNGDAILIDFEDELILIDAGYVSTYRDHLKERLCDLGSNGRRLSLFVVTHIDADHISGAITFLGENGDSENPKIIGVDEIWFNSYRHLKLDNREVGVFEDGAVPNLDIISGMESTEAESGDQLVSSKQGTTFGSLILKNNYNWNTHFNGNAVAADTPLSVPLSSEINIVVLGPTNNALSDLGDFWYDYLKEIYKGKINEDSFFDDAFEKMMEGLRQQALSSGVQLDQEGLVSDDFDWVPNYLQEWDEEDDSPTNASSIILLIESQGRRLLFLGDSFPSLIHNQLSHLLEGIDQVLNLDILKVAHHGAWYNNSPELLGRLSAHYYLFSSDGKRHNHPHMQTIAHVLDLHRERNKTLVFNYRNEDKYNYIENATLKTKYAYETQWPSVDKFGQGLNGYISLVLEALPDDTGN